MKHDALDKIQAIKLKLQLGEISYTKAIEMSKPALDEMNEEGRKIAKKFDRKHHDFTFIQIMR